jgi:hypothetical protein
MTSECERIEQLLDREEAPALPADLQAHAASCDLCRLRLAIARDLAERLGAGALPKGVRRAAIVDRIVGAGGSAHERRPVRRRAWIAAAALTAAAVAAVVILWPARPEPVLPTEVFAAMLGPFAEAPAKEEAGVPAPAEPTSPLEDALGLFWNDMEGPVGLARSAMEAPRATVPPPPPAKNK